MKIQSVLVVEDQLLFREFLVQKIKSAGYPVIGEVGTLKEAERVSQEHEIDTVILDMDLPDGNGMDYIQRQLDRRPSTRILVLTAHTSSYQVVSLKKGALVMGVLDKEQTDGRVLEEAMKSIEGWRPYYAENVERSFQSIVREPNSFYKLFSQREEEMVKHFGRGRNNRVISEKLGISESTVQGHRRNVMSKAGVKSTPELIIWSIKNGFVLPKDIDREDDEEPDN